MVKRKYEVHTNNLFRNTLYIPKSEVILVNSKESQKYR